MQSLALLVIATSICAAVSVALIVWNLRKRIARRYERDVGWLESTALMFSPERPDARRNVLIAYIIHCGVVLPLLLIGFPSPLIGLGMWMSIWFLPKVIAESLWSKRLDRIDEQLPAAIRKFSALCSAGLSTADALRQLAEETSLPIQYEFRTMAREWDLGADLTTITESAARRLKMDSFRLFSAAISMNNRLGGNLVKTLGELGESLSDQFEMKREINAAMAEGKMSTYGLLMGPPVMLGIVTFLDPKAVHQFFASVFGLAIFVVAVLLIGAGYFWARSIAQIKV